MISANLPFLLQSFYSDHKSGARTRNALLIAIRESWSANQASMTVLSALCCR